MRGVGILTHPSFCFEKSQIQEQKRNCPQISRIMQIKIPRKEILLILLILSNILCAFCAFA